MVCPYDGMEFDALEAMQCMLERRKGGETGVKAVQLLEGDNVWAAGDSGRWSKDVLRDCHKINRTFKRGVEGSCSSILHETDRAPNGSSRSVYRRP